MLALGLQGSPRKKGNTETLLSMFMERLREEGVATQVIEVCRRHIEPCKEMTVCEKKGICPIKDDMDEIYGLLRRADIVIAASPVFFYNVTAQLKALIDRCQTLWARKYMLKLQDPGHDTRRGFLLGVGATAGKQLFDGMHLTVRYFFDGIAAAYIGDLTYRKIEARGQIKNHPRVHADVSEAAARLMDGLLQRVKVTFVSRQNACRSQMAAAFTRRLAGHRLDVMSAGTQPAAGVNPAMETVMAESGIDMGFSTTQPIEAALEAQTPDILVTMGCADQCPEVPGARRLDWDLPDPGDRPIETVRSMRDEIEARVKTFVETI